MKKRGDKRERPREGMGTGLVAREISWRGWFHMGGWVRVAKECVALSPWGSCGFSMGPAVSAVHRERESPLSQRWVFQGGERGVWSWLQPKRSRSRLLGAAGGKCSANSAPCWRGAEARGCRKPGATTATINAPQTQRAVCLLKRPHIYLFVIYSFV